MENKPIGFRFTGIQVVSKTMEEMPKDGISGTFYFDIRVENRINAENNAVIPFVTITIKDEKTEKKLANFHVACAFEVESFKEIVALNPNGTYEIPANLELIFRQVSLSTVRGIIFSELSGTYLHNAIMPVIFVNTFKNEEAKMPELSFPNV